MKKPYPYYLMQVAMCTHDNTQKLYSPYLFIPSYGNRFYDHSYYTCSIWMILLTCRGRACIDTMRTICWNKAEIASNRQKQTYQTTSGVIMVMYVTYSLHPMCTLVHSVTHSHRWKQMSTIENIMIINFWRSHKWLDSCGHCCLDLIIFVSLILLHWEQVQILQTVSL